MTILWAACIGNAICVAAQMVAAPSSNSGEPQLHSYLEQASQAMHRGDNATAVVALRHALRIDPHSIAALNNLGIVTS